MSLDIWLKATVETTVFDKNITHNLCGMWKEAGIYEALYESKGKTAESVLPQLEQGLKQMTESPERFKVFNASNGWGTYEQALPWLAELIEGFKEYPQGIIETWV